MKLKDILYHIKVLFPLVPTHSEEEDKLLEKKLVALVAQGNVNLYLGKYVTSNEINQRKAILSSYDFSPKG